MSSLSFHSSVDRRKALLAGNPEVQDSWKAFIVTDLRHVKKTSKKNSPGYLVYRAISIRPISWVVFFCPQPAG